MINQEEAAICKRRGHDASLGLKLGWTQCKWCGTWLREVCTIEEREDAPPEDEQNPVSEFSGGSFLTKNDNDERRRSILAHRNNGRFFCTMQIWSCTTRSRVRLRASSSAE